MPDAPTMTGTPAEGTTVATPAPEAAESVLTLERIEALLEAKLAPITSKMSNELAKVRRHVKGTESAPAETPATQPPASLTLDDLRASREVGRLEAQLGDDTIKALGDDYSSMTPAEQARILRVLVAAKPQTAGVGDGSRGVMPAKTQQTSRAEPPQPRDAPAHPRTLSEYMALASTNKELKKILDADPTFHPEDLPRR